MDPLTMILLTMIPTLINGIGAGVQGKKSSDYYTQYLNMLEQNKVDMRKSIQARQQAYLGMEKVIFGKQISNPVDYSNYTPMGVKGTSEGVVKETAKKTAGYAFGFAYGRGK